MTLRRRDVLLGVLGTGLALVLPASAAQRAIFAGINTRIWQIDWFSCFVVGGYHVEDKTQPIGERIWFHAHTLQGLLAWHLQSSPKYWMKAGSAWAGVLCFDDEGDKELPAFETYVPEWTTVSDSDLRQIRDGLPLLSDDIVSLASAEIFYREDNQPEPYCYGPKRIDPLLVSREGRVVTG